MTEQNQKQPVDESSADMADQSSPANHEAEIGKPGLWATVMQRTHNFDIFGRAAQLAYYQLFSIFPTLILVAILLSMLPMDNLWDNLLGYLRGVLPPQAYALMDATLEQASGRRPHGLLSLSLFVLIWASSSGMEALISSLNAAYDATASRGWWRERVLAILLTLGLSTFILMSLTIVVFGSSIISLVAVTYGYGETFKAIWKTAQWPIAATFVMIGLDLIYYFAPNVRQPWRWVTPGAAIGLGCWLVISLGLKLYVSQIYDFNVTYGVLGSFMILMFWLYLTSAAILFGGVINGAILRR